MNRMNRMNLIVFIIVILLFSLPNAFADFGLVLSEGFLAEHNDETDIANKLTLAPWLSLPFGSADFYLSAGLSANYEEKLFFVPELFRAELSYRTAAGASPGLGMRLGRIKWQDPTRFTAVGTFDGAEVFAELGSVSLGAAALYTGLQYKNSANVNISPGDPKDYGATFDWGDFADTYFAPRRLLTSIYGDFPGFPSGRADIQAGLMAQFDFSDAEEAFHTQYLLLRYTFYYKSIDLTAAGALELENTDADGIRAAYAFSAEGGLQTGLLVDRLSLGLRWASGDGAATAPFFPLIREAQGIAFKPILSGMMVIRANYQARLLPSLSAQLGGRYFIRTDSTSYIDPYIEHDSYLLGAEVDGTLLWLPFSDLSFSMSAGLFFPKTGAAMAADAPLRWAINIGAIFSF